MDYLVQNSTQAPIFLHIVRNRDGKPTSEGTIVFEGGNTVTKVSQEIYEEFMMKNAFYRQRIEQGQLIVLNNSSENVDQKVKSGIQAQELAYNRYVSLVEKIQATGGLAEPRLRPFLDSDGMPMLELCRKNLGNVDPQVIEDYRRRYIVEKANGLHGNELVLPTGTIPAGNPNPVVKEEQGKAEVGEGGHAAVPSYETMSMEQLKAVADENGVSYNEDISFQRLLMRVKKAMHIE